MENYDSKMATKKPVVNNIENAVENKVNRAYVPLTKIDDSFQKELLKEFYSSAKGVLDKIEFCIFDYIENPQETKSINELKVAIHSLIGSALSVEHKQLAQFLYRFDEIILENINEKSVDKYLDFYYFVVDKFRAYFYQLENEENVELIEKIITSILQRKGESEKAYLQRCIKDLETQLEALKSELAKIDEKSSPKT